MILTPAYGRSYPTIKAALEDWAEGKDFKIWSGPYCSIRDIEFLKKDFSIIEIWNNLSGSETAIIWNNDPMSKFVPITYTDEVPE
jgi:hypothetical protein